MYRAHKWSESLAWDAGRQFTLFSGSTKRLDWKKAGGKDYDVEQRNFSRNDLPRVVKAGARVWPWTNALLAPPGWKARCTDGILLKCAHTLFPVTCISAGQELTCTRQELASCWPWSSTGMRGGAAPSCLTPPHLSKLPSGLPHRHIIISEPFITLLDLVKKCLKYLKSWQRVRQDKQMKHFSLETRLKAAAFLWTARVANSCSHKYFQLLQKWLLAEMSTKLKSRI